MNLWKTIWGIALAWTLLTGCGGWNKWTTSEDVDSTLECTITQVWKITENNATVNTKCEDPDWITLWRIVVDWQIIELIIPENTTEFDIKTTIEKLPSDQNTSLELEVGSVNWETGETDLNTFTWEVETKSPEIIDTEKPTITLNWPQTITLTVWDTYTEQWAEANDNLDWNLTNEIIIDNSSVDTSVAGTYNVTYTVFDLAGNETIVTRIVEVIEVPTPILTFTADNKWTPDNDLVAIEETQTNITFKIDTPQWVNYWNWTAEVLVKVSNDGYIEVDWTIYNDWEYFSVNDWGSWTIKLLKSDWTEVWSKTYTWVWVLN